MLLDTHILLWWLEDNIKLPKRARREISEPGNTIFFSPASIWEAAIKASIGRLDVPETLPDDIGHEDFEELLVSAGHAWTAGFLPPHHQDPFDRMLAAQALEENLTLVSVDEIFDDYGVRRLSL